ncbi:MAG: hypothetical protein JWL95_2085 [Gemmatimonadetes bacterium]|nr:hypothetical protein [Gemmatimonadota bacterium]
MASACLAPASAAAEECALVESRSSLAQLSGVRIAAVDIVAEGASLPGPARALNGLHVVSRDATIRRQLLFAAGDTVDTLRVSETMRRLRRGRLFSDVVVAARRCSANGAVTLVVRSRDVWTMRPTARLKTPSLLSFGFEDKNILGTGRTVAVTHEMSMRGRGAALSVTDPWVLGQDVAGNLRIASLGGAHAFRAGIRKHEYSVFDRWRAEVNVARLSFGDTVATERALHTLDAMTLVGRRVGHAVTSATTLLAGAEFDSAASVPSASRALVTSGPRARSFVGLDIGLLRRTAQFDTASWVVPGRGFLDVPLGWETDVVVAAGRERVVGTTALKVDSWLGRVWMPRRGRILMADGWVSGFMGRGVSANHIARASVAWYADAPRGMWGLRATAEQLVDLDPDLRGLSLMPLADYTAPTLPGYVARGGRSVAGSIERSMRVHRVGINSMLDAGAFLAGSYRWRVEDVPGNALRSGVIGTRLRVLSSNGAVNSMRVDVGYPVVRSGVLPNRAFALLTIGTLFDVSRQRDGRRIY